MECAVAFAEDLGGHVTAQQPQGQFSDGRRTLWEWIYNDFAESWGGFPAMWQLCINAGWACQKVIEALGDEFEGDFVELISAGVAQIDEDMVAGKLNGNSFTEAYFTDLWMTTFIRIENKTRDMLRTHTTSPT
jgi:hypothetical protein